MGCAIFSSAHQAILEKAAGGKRLNREEGTQLFSCDLPSLSDAATQVRHQKHPQNIVTFVIDRNISYTNACIVDCGFCAFHKPYGDPGAYVLSLEEIFSKIQELVDAGGTQVMIQGGVNSDLPLDFLSSFNSIYPRAVSQAHLHSFSAIEIDFLAKREKMPIRDLLIQFKEAGLHSLPGAGAEILVDRVRQQLSPKKTSSERWLEIMKMAHEVGLRSTATMVIGHVETLEERILHFEALRNLQDETHGFRSFIVWTLSPKGTPRMSHLEQASGADYLRTVAIARLYLDNFENIQSGWLTEGLKLGQAALAFGANDIGGTLIEDKVLEPTGVRADARREDLIRLIRNAGFIPAQRNTNYEILRTFDS